VRLMSVGMRNLIVLSLGVFGLKNSI